MTTKTRLKKASQAAKAKTGGDAIRVYLIHEDGGATHNGVKMTPEEYQRHKEASPADMHILVSYTDDLPSEP